MKFITLYCLFGFLSYGALGQSSHIGLTHRSVASDIRFVPTIKFYRALPSNISEIMIRLHKDYQASYIKVSTLTVSDKYLRDAGIPAKATFFFKQDDLLPENQEKLRRSVNPTESYMYGAGLNLLVNFLANGW